MFKLNDHVIYPGHGAAIIKDIIEKMIGESSVKFLKLNFLFKDMTILVPTYNVASIGIRYPSSEQDINTMLHELLKKPERRLESIDFTPSGWNRRHKDYQVKIQSGKLLEIAKIYRDLMHIAQQKDLSFGERAILQTTEELLVQEVQMVTAKCQESVTQLLRNPFKQFLFHDPTFLQKETQNS